MASRQRAPKTSLGPLICNIGALDALRVKINPLSRPGLPEAAEEMADHVNEITFSAVLVGEMRAVVFVQRRRRVSR